MTEQAKATARKFFEEQDRLGGGPADELCGDGYTARLGSFPPMDLEGHKSFSTAFYAAFPDLKHTIEDMVGEGDRVALSMRLTGTHKGSFMGQSPTGKRIDVGGLALMTIASEKVVDVQGQFDEVGLMQQIGAA